MNVTEFLKKQGFEEICSTDEKVLDFIHNVKHQDHSILIFQNQEARDKIVNEFINTKFIGNGVTACFSNNPTKYNCNHKITYNQLVQEQKFQPDVVTDFLIKVLDSSFQKKSTRIACEDTAWLAKEGFFEEHQEYGNKMDEMVLKQSVILCCYDSSKLDEEQMKTILASRRFVILEEPFSVYEKIQR